MVRCGLGDAQAMGRSGPALVLRYHFSLPIPASNAAKDDWFLKIATLIQARRVSDIAKMKKA
jgi:hypothetical protein